MIQTSFFPQPEKDEPIKIIQIHSSGFQPKKLEEINYRKCADLLADTYMIYPTGGYHLFYGVPNTLPRYQLPIWPYIKRIKWTTSLVKSPKIQVMPRFSTKRGYVEVTVNKKGYYTANYYTQLNKNGAHYINKKNQNKIVLDLHGLVARAFIPNPDNKPNVLHINDDPTNYLIENLMWGTQRDNMKGVKKIPQTPEHKYLDLVNKGLIKG